MNRIRVLEKSVAERIAAGEVVERPASAVKELLENAIDAGASAVTLEIKNGGVSFIRVSDNGCGILREDLPAAFLRHATSKVWSAEDLEAIGTLGFRGEALASISAVAKVEMITRTSGELSGSRMVVEGGTVTETGDAGCPQGTTILVRELFYNTPARMKFLKKDVSEGNAVAAVAQRIALSHPEVSLKFIRDGKTELHTPGDNRLISAVHAVLGREFAQSLVPVSYELNGIRLQGYAAKPVTARANRNFQFFFLNGRLVRSGTAAAALEEAYRGSIMVGRFPACVLLIGISPSLVDVNVHPAKLEVRFANEKQVFDAVYYGVKTALEAADAHADFQLKKQNPSPAAGAALFGAPVSAAPQLSVALPHRTPVIQDAQESPLMVKNTAHAVYEAVSPEKIPEKPAHIPQRLAETTATAISTGCMETAQTVKTSDEGMTEQQAAARPDYRIIGQCFETYFLVESGGELLLIDKHAAHERILYEEIKSRGRAVSQQLLEPVAVTLSPEEHEAVLENASLLEEAGFYTEDFGGLDVILRAAPAYLSAGEAGPALAEMAGYLARNFKDAAPKKLERIYHSVACRAAVKAGDRTGPAEEEKLVRRVLENDDIRYCPHGRPVVISLKRHEIEKQFGRA